MKDFDSNTDLGDHRSINEYIESIKRLSDTPQSELGQRFYNDKIATLLNLLHNLKQDLEIYEEKNQ